MICLRDLIVDLCLVYQPRQETEHVQEVAIDNNTLDTKIQAEDAIETIAHEAEPEPARPNNPVLAAFDYFHEFISSSYQKIRASVKKAYSDVKNSFAQDKPDPVKAVTIKQMRWYGLLPMNNDLRKVWATYVT